MSDLSGNRQARSWLIVSPAIKQVRSDGVANAWTQRYLAAKLDSAGRVCPTTRSLDQQLIKLMANLCSGEFLPSPYPFGLQMSSSMNNSSSADSFVSFYKQIIKRRRNKFVYRSNSLIWEKCKSEPMKYLASAMGFCKNRLTFALWHIYFLKYIYTYRYIFLSPLLWIST